MPVKRQYRPRLNEVRTKVCDICRCIITSNIDVCPTCCKWVQANIKEALKKYKK